MPVEEETKRAEPIIITTTQGKNNAAISSGAQLKDSTLQEGDAPENF